MSTAAGLLLAVWAVGVVRVGIACVSGISEGWRTREKPSILPLRTELLILALASTQAAVEALVWPLVAVLWVLRLYPASRRTR